MKPAAFEYLKPRDLPEAAAALGAEGSKLLGGGQSLGPMLNLRLARPSLLVDVSKLDSLRRIEETPDLWRIGGSVTHAQIEDRRGSLPGIEMMAEVAAGIAYRSVRNRGTIGGSLAHADPAADWPLALAVIDATVIASGKAGSRKIPADRFMIATFTTELKADEIIEAVEVPKLSASARTGYFKFCRKTGEFPEASAAIVLDGPRRVARLFIGALNGAPQSLPALAAAVAEKGMAAASKEAIVAALKAAAPELDAVGLRMHAGAVTRAISQAVGP